jgi:hypothetical protein
MNKPNSKFNPLVHSIIAFALAFVTLVILMFLEDQSYHTESELKTSLSQMQSYYEQIESRLGKTKEAISVFANTPKLKAHDFKSFKLDEAIATLEAIKHELGLKDLQIDITTPEVKELASHNFNNLIYLQVKASFASNTDVESYQFVDALYQKLPGYVQVLNYEVMPKTGHGFATNLEFVWLEIVNKNR